MNVSIGIPVTPVTREGRVILSQRHAPRLEQLASAGLDPVKLKEIPPIFMTLDLTWKCNLSCMGCIDRMDKDTRGELVQIRRDAEDLRRHMDWQIVQDLIGYSAQSGVEGFMIMGGEVMLYPEIDNFLYACARANLAVSIVSNGTLWDQHLDALVAAAQINHSSMRISINQFGQHYRTYARSSFSFDHVLNNVRMATERGIEVFVSTVVFGQAAAAVLKGGSFVHNNVDDLRPLSEALRGAGVRRHLFIPARNPNTKSTFELTPDEGSKLEQLKKAPPEGMKVSVAGLFSTNPLGGLECPICPTSLLKVLVGADGTLYACTDFREKEVAALGKIGPGKSFRDVWHSEERVRRQLEFSPGKFCAGHTCAWEEPNRTLSDLLTFSIRLSDIEMSDSQAVFF